MLVLYELIGEDTRTDLINFTLDCIENESHQTCVKQLLQLLIIKLTTNSTKFCKIILSKAMCAKQLHIQTSLIPILYQIAQRQDEEFCISVGKYLLKLTMGSQFALRLYGQVRSLIQAVVIIAM